MKYIYDHTGIVVKDLQKSVEFYSHVFGFTITDTYETDQIKIVSLDAGGITLELLQYSNDIIDHRQTGICDHIAFSVQNVDNCVVKLKALQVEFLFDKPKEIFNKKIIFFLGPDGERIELIEKINS